MLIFLNIEKIPVKVGILIFGLFVLFFFCCLEIAKLIFVLFSLFFFWLILSICLWWGYLM